MKCISLHQPWASLLVTRQPCGGCDSPAQPHRVFGCAGQEMVKRFETRSWPCPPSIIGQHVAFASTKRRTLGTMIDGAWKVFGTSDPAVRVLEHFASGHPGAPADILLPLGCVVGSGTITASYEIVDEWSNRQFKGMDAHVSADGRAGTLTLWTYSPYPTSEWDEVDISDQLPYGGWTPGRYAWLIEDAAATTERCPWCRGEGGCIAGEVSGHYVDWASCPVCDGAGRCEPIPVVGRQGFWNWAPA